jgi:hypothetical protein
LVDQCSRETGSRVGKLWIVTGTVVTGILLVDPALVEDGV